jgi:hypothetical protein
MTLFYSSLRLEKDEFFAGDKNFSFFVTALFYLTLILKFFSW